MFLNLLAQLGQIQLSPRLWRKAGAVIDVVEKMLVRVRTRRSVSRERLKNRSEEHTSELQSRSDLVCRLLLEKKKKTHVRSSSGSRLRSQSRDHVDAPNSTL